MTSFARLVSEHDAMVHRAEMLIALVADPPRPPIAAYELDRLRRMVSEHIATEDSTIYATVGAVRDTRHAATAEAAGRAYEELKRDWTGYLDCWAEQDIAGDWAGFARATQAMLPRLRDRLDWETAVLYSLALHHALLPPEAEGPAKPSPKFPAPSWQASRDRTV